MVGYCGIVEAYTYIQISQHNVVAHFTSNQQPKKIIQFSYFGSHFGLELIAFRHILPSHTRNGAMKAQAAGNDVIYGFSHLHPTK